MVVKVAGTASGKVRLAVFAPTGRPRRFGSGTGTLRATATTKVKVKLSRSALRLIHSRKLSRVRVTVTAPSVTAQRTYRITRRR